MPNGPIGSIQRSWDRLHGFYQRRASTRLFRRPFLVRPPRPIVSFTFDDFPSSALSIGGAILTRYGATGTYYASLGLADQRTASGCIFGSADLPVLLQQGHELGCHTFSHCDAWKTPTAVFERSIDENQMALERLLPGARFKTFSYPINVPQPRTKLRVAHRFLGCRGGGQTFNAGLADLNLLSAFFLEKSRNSLPAVKALIDGNSQAKGWLIFATHDISDSPTKFGCTPGFFEDVVKYAVGSGASIVPVVNALESLGAPAVAG